MSACVFCGVAMAEGVSCTAEVFTDLGPEPYARIRYGDPREGWEEFGLTPPPNCHDCAVPLGGFHHPGCDVEHCPLCDGQAITCDCTDAI